MTTVTTVPIPTLYQHPVVTINSNGGPLIQPTGSNNKIIVMVGTAPWGPDVPVLIDSNQAAGLFGDPIDPRTSGYTLPIAMYLAAQQQQPSGNHPIQFFVCRCGVRRATVGYVSLAGAAAATVDGVTYWDNQLFTFYGIGAYAGAQKGANLSVSIWVDPLYVFNNYTGQPVSYSWPNTLTPNSEYYSSIVQQITFVDNSTGQTVKSYNSNTNDLSSYAAIVSTINADNPLTDPNSIVTAVLGACGSWNATSPNPLFGTLDYVTHGGYATGSGNNLYLPGTNIITNISGGWGQIAFNTDGVTNYNQNYSSTLMPKHGAASDGLGTPIAGAAIVSSGTGYGAVPSDIDPQWGVPAAISGNYGPNTPYRDWLQYMLDQSLFVQAQYINVQFNAANGCVPGTASANASQMIADLLYHMQATNGPDALSYNWRTAVLGVQAGTSYATMQQLIASLGAASRRIVMVAHDAAYGNDPITGRNIVRHGYQMAAIAAGLKACGPTEETTMSFPVSGFVDLIPPVDIQATLTSLQLDDLAGTGLLTFVKPYGSDSLVVRDSLTTLAYQAFSLSANPNAIAPPYPTQYPTTPPPYSTTAVFPNPSTYGAPYSPLVQWNVGDIDDRVSEAIANNLIPFLGRPYSSVSAMIRHLNTAVYQALAGLGETINGIKAISTTVNMSTLTPVINVQYITRYPVQNIVVNTSFVFS